MTKENWYFSRKKRGAYIVFLFWAWANSLSRDFSIIKTINLIIPFDSSGFYFRCNKWVCRPFESHGCLYLGRAIFIRQWAFYTWLYCSKIPKLIYVLHMSLPEYFLASASCHQEAVEQTIMALQMDRDSDVKYFASIHPSSTKVSEDAMSTASSTYWDPESCVLFVSTKPGLIALHQSGTAVGGPSSCQLIRRCKLPTPNTSGFKSQEKVQ